VRRDGSRCETRTKSIICNYCNMEPMVTRVQAMQCWGVETREGLRCENATKNIFCNDCKDNWRSLPRELRVAINAWAATEAGVNVAANDYNAMVWREQCEWYGLPPLPERHPPAWERLPPVELPTHEELLEACRRLVEQPLPR